MGVVYRAQNTVLGSELAIKVLLDDNEVRRERFRREIDALWRLTHPNIVGLKDAGVQDDKPWFAMELVSGESVDQVLQRDGPFPIPQVIDLAEQVAAAMTVAHSHGILHRDLKPENVIRQGGEEGRYLVADFGLTRQVEAEEDLFGSPTPAEEEAISLTRTGALQGTPRFWAPEQAAGQSTTSSTDVYLFGSTLYAALTGGPPIEGETLLEIMVATAERAPIPPSELRTDLPADLEAIVLRCLAKQPEDRYESFEQVSQDLASLRAGKRLPHARGTADDRKSKRARVFLLKALGGVLLVALCAWPGWAPLRARVRDSRANARAAELAALEERALERADDQGADALVSLVGGAGRLRARAKTTSEHGRRGGFVGAGGGPLSGRVGSRELRAGISPA
ncbi:MAG: serine/threonine protein kinase [Planctomycetes bacterium]|nr:serine/threonine protein kinase [Planctomycetota bacterium]